jgi:glycosyltransferase involved in cell wall biosynthesis
MSATPSALLGGAEKHGPAHDVAGEPLRVLMIGPALTVQGGVSAVEQMLVDFLPADVKVDHVASMVEGTNLRKALTFARALVRTRAQLRQRPDIVHIHFASYGSTARKMLIARLAMASGARVVMHAHGGAYREFWQWMPRVPRASTLHTLTRIDRLIVLGERWREFFASIGVPRERIVVLPNPVVLPAQLPTRLPRSQVRMVYLGLVAQRKGTFDLIEALALLPQDCRARLRVILAGKGEMPRLREQIARHGLEACVELRGWIGPLERDQLLASAHAFVLPSYVEGLPMSLLEAMAWGLAPISTPVGSIPEYVRDGVNGWLVRPGAIAELARAIERIVTDDARCARMGELARATVEPLSVQRYAQQIQDLYRSVAVGGESVCKRSRRS